MTRVEAQAIAADRRAIVFRTKGHSHGPVTRLFSPGDLGHQIKPFILLDRIDMEASSGALFGWHPHSGIATITTVVQGDTLYADSTGAEGVLKAGGVEFMQHLIRQIVRQRPDQPRHPRPAQIVLDRAARNPERPPDLTRAYSVMRKPQ